MIFLNGDAIKTPDMWGRKIRDDSFLFLVNAHYEPLEFRLPESSWGDFWEWVIDTGRGGFIEGAEPLAGGSKVNVSSRAVVVLVKRIEE